MSKFMCRNVLFIFCLSLVQTVLAEQASEKDAYSKAAEMYLPTLVNQQQDELAAVEKTKKDFEKKTLKDKIKTQFELPEIGNYEALQFIYNRFSTFAKMEMKKNKQADQNSKKLFSENIFGDLEIFCGGKRNLQKSIVTFADNTKTPWGKLVWQSFFTQDFENIGLHKKELIRRQDIVKILVEDEKLFKQIDDILSDIANDALKVAFFEKEMEGLVKRQIDDTIYFGSHWYGDLTPWNEKNKILNMSFFWATSPRVMHILMGVVSGLYITRQCSQKRMPTPKAFGYGLLSGCGVAAFYYGLMFLMDFLIGDISQLITHLANGIHSKVNGVAITVSGMNKLAKLIESNSKFKALFTNYKNLQIDSSSKDVELGKLFDELKKDTFKGEPSYFSNKGRALACFKKILRLRNRFITSFKALGEIDACMSIAKLYKKYANHSNAKFCFVDFVSAQKPYINIQNFWHPFLDPDTVVTNSIELGTDTAGHNVILTGPNAAGKSSALKGIIVSIILAETLGIAPASQMAITPFARISSHLNISDDQGRESLYQAEKNRVISLLSDVKKLGKNEFEFVIMDEMFSSTNPEEGQAAAYAIAKSLSKNSNFMCMLATHFKKLSELEQDTNGYFKNYKVYVEELPDGNIRCPYKVVPGVSNQNIAILMLKQDFDSDIVSEAYNILADIKQDTSEIVGFGRE